MASNKCLEASRLTSRWGPVSTDGKRLTTLLQYKTWLFNTRESASKSRREVEPITTKLVASLVHKCYVVLLKLLHLWFVRWHHWQYTDKFTKISRSPRFLGQTTHAQTVYTRPSFSIESGLESRLIKRVPRRFIPTNLIPHACTLAKGCYCAKI